MARPWPQELEAKVDKPRLNQEQAIAIGPRRSHALGAQRY
ncbi:primosome assembly protein PriA [Vibrio cholerae]|nr:primosome assembly protein PriA [Vibrio cholerae]